MVKSCGGKRAGGYVVVAPEIILSTPGTGSIHPHSQSQSLDNIEYLHIKDLQQIWTSLELLLGLFRTF